MELVNLTPHPIRIVVGLEETLIPPSGNIARVVMEEGVVGVIGGTPLIKRTPSQVCGLPTTPSEGVGYLVSSMVLDNLDPEVYSGRVFAPDTGPTAIRNDSGQVVGVTRLVTL